MKIAIAIVLFLLIGAFFIISEKEIKLNNEENINTFVSLYTVWITGILDNIKGISGSVVKMEWLPKE